MAPPVAAGGSLEAWQPASLAQRFGDRLLNVTKPFLTGGGAALPPLHPLLLLQLLLLMAASVALAHSQPAQQRRKKKVMALNADANAVPTVPAVPAGRTTMRLADYMSYAQQQHDEEPLYVFDA